MRLAVTRQHTARAATSSPLASDRGCTVGNLGLPASVSIHLAASIYVMQLLGNRRCSSRRDCLALFGRSEMRTR